MENDISMLKLATPASGFEPICLPEAGHLYTGINENKTQLQNSIYIFLNDRSK